LIGQWGTSPTGLTTTTTASPPFVVGASIVLTAPSSSGEYFLYLAENDGNFSDNGGAFSVTATFDTPTGPCP
jgi:hypothetical protein